MTIDDFHRTQLARDVDRAAAQYERRTDFVAWSRHTLNDPHVRVAILQPWPGAGIVWQQVSLLSGEPREHRRSAGSFYDTSDPDDHPEGALEWCEASIATCFDLADARAMLAGRAR